MLFPTNPEKRPELWGRFVEKLIAGEVTFVVHRGQVLPEAGRNVSTAESVDQVIGSFRAASIVRFGAERGQAIGPFFALHVTNGAAQLVEFAIDHRMQSSSGSDVQEALQSLAINLFFESKEIREISIPFALSKWEVPEWSAIGHESGTTLRRDA